MVSELIDDETHWWKVCLLEKLFTKEEVQLILTLPISVSSQADMCIWRGTKNGTFSIKNAYYLQKEIESRGLVESSSMGAKSPVWKQIWGLKIPNVEKNFLW